MVAEFPEKDWKYLSRIRPELLEELSRRTNDELRELLQKPGISENDRRGMIYDLVHEKDRVVAVCFDDWRRSRALEKCWQWQRHGLLKQEHVENLTEETRSCVTPTSGLR